MCETWIASLNAATGANGKLVGTRATGGREQRRGRPADWEGEQQKDCTLSYAIHLYEARGIKSLLMCDWYSPADVMKRIRESKGRRTI